MPSEVQAPVSPPPPALDPEPDAELEPELAETVAAAVAVVLLKRAEETGAALATPVAKPEGAEVLVLMAGAELGAPKPDTLKIETGAALDAAWLLAGAAGAAEAEAAVYAPAPAPAALDAAWLLAGADDAAAPALPLAAGGAACGEEPPAPSLHCPSGQQLVPVTS